MGPRLDEPRKSLPPAVDVGHAGASIGAARFDEPRKGKRRRPIGSPPNV